MSSPYSAAGSRARACRGRGRPPRVSTCSTLVNSEPRGGFRAAACAIRKAEGSMKPVQEPSAAASELLPQHTVLAKQHQVRLAKQHS